VLSLRHFFAARYATRRRRRYITRYDFSMPRRAFFEYMPLLTLLCERRQRHILYDVAADIIFHDYAAIAACRFSLRVSSPLIADTPCCHGFVCIRCRSLFRCCLFFAMRAIDAPGFVMLLRHAAFRLRLLRLFTRYAA